MFLHHILTALCMCVLAAQAVSDFQTQCTTSNQTVSYVSSPHTRGTLDIVWNCLATLVACVYTMLHLNIPERNTRPQTVSTGTTELWESFKDYMWVIAVSVVSILFPELVWTASIDEWMDARTELQRLRKSIHQESK
jgi:hypothetical protein